MDGKLEGVFEKNQGNKDLKSKILKRKTLVMKSKHLKKGKINNSNYI